MRQELGIAKDLTSQSSSTDSLTGNYNRNNIIDYRRRKLRWLMFAAIAVTVIGILFGVVVSILRRRGDFQQSDYVDNNDVLADDGQDEPKEWDEFTSLYIEQFKGRKPPSGLEEWFKYALKHRCHTHPRFFVRLQDDLEPFREIVKTNGKIKIKDVKAVLKDKNDRDLIGYLELGGKWKSPDNYHKNLYGPTHEIFKTLKKRITLITNSWDEPISLLSKSSSGKYESALDAVRAEPCFAENYGKFGDFKSKLYSSPAIFAPMSFPAVNYPIPALSSSKPEHCFGDLVSATFRTGAFIAKELGAGKKGPWLQWKEKTDTLMFRGSNTGGKVDLDAEYPIEWYPRHRMIDWMKTSAVKDRVKLDLVLTSHINLSESNETINEKIKKTYPARKEAFLSLKEQFKAKYLLVIDGNGWPNRTTAFLLSGSVVLLMTAFRDWVSDQLQPMVHYVPVKTDFSDLDEKLTWLLENPEEAEMIGKRGRAYARRFLRVEDMASYTAFQALELAQLID